MSHDIGEVQVLSKSGMGIGPGLPLSASAGGIEELRCDIQRLMDMEAIKQTKHAYFRCIDTANWEELGSICHPDLKVHYIGGGYEYRMANREEFLSAMKQAFHSEAVARHNGHMPEIQILSENEATGIWYLYDHFWSLNANHLTHGTALYWDSYVKVNGSWLIKATSYRRIYQMNEKLHEKPQLVSHYLSEHGIKVNG
ncbi:MAG: nuclear transport factor 2 family protein [Halioglobus sp.]|nr:nuclear transport factor 2 family protein [Halioglobus sp.]